MPIIGDLAVCRDISTIARTSKRNESITRANHRNIAIISRKTLFLEEWLPLSDKTLPERYRLIRDYADEMLMKQARELSTNLPKLEDDLKLAIQQQTDFFDGHLPYLQTLNLDSPADIQHLLQDDQSKVKLYSKTSNVRKRITSII